MAEPRDVLVGSWTHSHEEDGEGITVYRRSDAEFPPARRPRVTLEFAADGGLRRGDPAPDDGLSVSTGRWSLDGQLLTLAIEGRPEAVFRIEAVDQQRLVLAQSA